MKKIKFLCLMAIGLLAMGSFTSCDDDKKEALRLAGVWSGDFGMYYTEIVADRNGNIIDKIRRDCDHTTIEFLQDNDWGIATTGEGFQVDYYTSGPYEYISHHFDWKIRDGVMYFNYYAREDQDLNAELTEYTLTFNRFYGTFSNGERFSLRKYENAWTRDDYYVGGPDGWCCSRSVSRSIEEDADVVRTIVVGNSKLEK